ncbi:MAG TPA: PqiC family protein [Anaeromyxobacteraceae bacterium]|nr:PqiC family protein [Anaeromyxobacteraceae bacterium]
MSAHRTAPAATPRHRFVTFALWVLVATQGACASSWPSRYYQLHSAVRLALRDEATRPGALVVGIGPVRVPDYLDRPEIVTVSGSRIDVAEFDRWAGSVENNIARVLVEDLTGLLPTERFFVTHWRLRPPSPSCRIEVLVEHFEGPLQGPVLLRAQWFVHAADGRLLLGRSSSISEEVTGGDYGALVEAMSRALEGLSQAIAKDITSLSPAQAAR